MSVIQDVIRGALKLNGLPERECFSTFREFIESLPRLLTVEIPSSVSNVIVSSSSPNEDNRDKIWLRRSPNGAFVGWYVFANGQWEPFYNIPREQVVWLFGDSNNPPDGFVFITDGDSVILPTVVNALKAQYVATGGGNYYYYAARYVGP